MSAKVQAARQPSIDELLASIRQAIHERVAPEAPAAPAASVRLQVRPRPDQSHQTRSSRDDQALDIIAEPPARVETSGMKRTAVTSGQDGFAGLLGGDVRLEEALARLNQTGPRRSDEAHAAAEKPREPAGAAAAPAAEPRLRPSIDAWTGGSDSPAAAASPAPAPEPAPKMPATPAWRLSGAHTRTGSDRKEPRKETPMPDKPAASRTADALAGTRPRDLLSAQAASRANSAFDRLTDAVGSRSAGGDRALDEMTRDCLRPLLKAWLDENLPGLVERLVREEIERVARSGR